MIQELVDYKLAMYMDREGVNVKLTAISEKPGISVVRRRFNGNICDYECQFFCYIGFRENLV